MEKLLEWAVKRSGFSFSLSQQQQIISSEHSTTPYLVLFPYIQNVDVKTHHGWFRWFSGIMYVKCLAQSLEHVILLCNISDWHPGMVHSRYVEAPRKALRNSSYQTAGSCPRGDDRLLLHIKQVATAQRIAIFSLLSLFVVICFRNGGVGLHE